MHLAKLHPRLWHKASSARLLCEALSFLQRQTEDHSCFPIFLICWWWCGGVRATLWWHSPHLGDHVGNRYDKETAISINFIIEESGENADMEKLEGRP